MNTEIEVLICYDVQDNKKRQKLFLRLKQLGLISIQKSVFWGYILAPEKSAILREFHSILEEGDKAFIINTDLSKKIQNWSFGYTDYELFKKQDFFIF